MEKAGGDSNMQTNVTFPTGFIYPHQTRDEKTSSNDVKPPEVFVFV